MERDITDIRKKSLAGHKSLKKPAKEVGSESWKIYTDTRAQSSEMGGVNPEELDI